MTALRVASGGWSPTCARKAAKVLGMSDIATTERPPLSLSEVAAILGVTRSAVNLMVHDGRLPARRDGHRWVVSAQDVKLFQENYQPAPSAGRKLAPRGGQPHMVDVVLELLREWGEARVDELSEVLCRDPGNVRKYLAILHARGLAEKTSAVTWAAAGSAATATAT